MDRLNVQPLVRLIAFVDSQMRGPPAIIIEGQACPCHGLWQSGARIILLEDKKINNAEIMAVELPGKKKQVSRQKQAPGDTCLISFSECRHNWVLLIINMQMTYQRESYLLYREGELKCRIMITMICSRETPYKIRHY
jgi:hypothetical protein